ncbi:MAG TPA: response regulator [Candidatus Didemnitutus sp.]|jgi:CheY-like chemotaxis protein
MNFTGKILVVDDEAHIRKYVTLMARTLGRPTVIEAANGQDAVAIFAREKPDLILLDINMPRMDGVETLQAIRALDRDCVIVMLTSLVNRQTVEECARLGANDYLRKDVPQAEMAAQLQRVIEEEFTDEPPAPPVPGP